jgi:hypothetical protein
MSCSSEQHQPRTPISRYHATQTSHFSRSQAAEFPLKIATPASHRGKSRRCAKRLKTLGYTFDFNFADFRTHGPCPPFRQEPEKVAPLHLAPVKRNESPTFSAMCEKALFASRFECIKGCGGVLSVIVCSRQLGASRRMYRSGDTLCNA